MPFLEVDKDLYCSNNASSSTGSTANRSKLVDDNQKGSILTVCSMLQLVYLFWIKLAIRATGVEYGKQRSRWDRQRGNWYPNLQEHVRLVVTIDLFAILA